MTEAAAVSTAHAFIASWSHVTPSVMSHPSTGLITHMIQSMVSLKVFPKRLDTARVPEGELHSVTQKQYYL